MKLVQTEEDHGQRSKDTEVDVNLGNHKYALRLRYRRKEILQDIQNQILDGCICPVSKEKMLKDFKEEDDIVKCAI